MIHDRSQIPYDVTASYLHNPSWPYPISVACALQGDLGGKTYFIDRFDTLSKMYRIYDWQAEVTNTIGAYWKALDLAIKSP